MEWQPINAAAAQVAWAAKRSDVSIDDVAVVCLRDPKLCRVLADLGTSLAAVERALTEKLASPPVTFDAIGEREGPQGISTAWSRVFAAAGELAVHRSLFARQDMADLLLVCLREPACMCRQALADLGVSPRRLALYLSHGIDGDPPLEPLDSARAEVIVFDDDITPGGFVCSALQAVLKVPHDVSHPLMQRIGAKGKVAVFIGAPDEARRIEAELRSRASENGMGLLVVAKPASGAVA